SEGDAVWVRDGDAVCVQDDETDGRRMVNGTASLSVHRIWNESWQRNGRLYGPWVQNLPKQTRRSMVNRSRSPIIQHCTAACSTISPIRKCRTSHSRSMAGNEAKLSARSIRW